MNPLHNDVNEFLQHLKESGYDVLQVDGYHYYVFHHGAEQNWGIY